MASRSTTTGLWPHQPPTTNPHPNHNPPIHDPLTLQLPLTPSHQIWHHPDLILVVSTELLHPQWVADLPPPTLESPTPSRSSVCPWTVAGCPLRPSRDPTCPSLWNSFSSCTVMPCVHRTLASQLCHPIWSLTMPPSISTRPGSTQRSWKGWPTSFLTALVLSTHSISLHLCSVLCNSSSNPTQEKGPEVERAEEKALEVKTTAVKDPRKIRWRRRSWKKKRMLKKKSVHHHQTSLLPLPQLWFHRQLWARHHCPIN